MPKISVIMSVYNEPEKWIRQAIDSILKQTFIDFEFIIINDNPANQANKNLLKQYADHENRIRIIENEENKGLTKSLNIGIEASKGKYIARMDADDISMPNRFQIQYDFMESHPEIDVCGSCALLFGSVPCFSSKKLIVPESNEEIKIRSLIYSPMVHPSVMIRLERLPRKLYNDDFKKAQDYVLWGELINNGYTLYNIQECLIKYRITTKSGKRDYRFQQRIAADAVRAQLLHNLCPKIEDKTISLHNKICNEQECNLANAEEWLTILKVFLIKRYPPHKDAVVALISRLWININLTNGNSVCNYRKSELTEHISITDSLRFTKRKLCKCWIFSRLLGGVN